MDNPKLTWTPCQVFFLLKIFIFLKLKYFKVQYLVSKEIVVLPNVEIVLKYVTSMCCLRYVLILFNLF